MNHNNYYQKNKQQLKKLMDIVGISNLKELSIIARVSERELYRLQYGLIGKMNLETLISISNALQISLSNLVNMLEPKLMTGITDENLQTIEKLKQEYKILLENQEKQKESLKKEFIEKSIKKLETWLLQWPTAAAAARKNNQLPAVRLLPLLKPIEELLKEWGITEYASVGEELAYDPQWHQLIEGTAKIGERVRVRYPGYLQGDKLRLRAQVSLIENKS